MTSIRQSLNAVLAVFVLLLAMALPAAAQAATTWLPSAQSFDPNKAVYLDPALANHPTYPVSLNGLEAKLRDESRAHGLKFYFVMTELGDDASQKPSNYRNFAVWKLDLFAQMVASKIPQDKYVLVLLVRKNDDPNKFSYAVNGGSQLQEVGLTGSFFNNTSILDNARNMHLPNDPIGFADKVAAGINQAIDNHYAELKRQEEWRKQEAERQRLEQIRRAEEERQRVIEEARKAEEWARTRAEMEKNARIFGPPVGMLIIGGIFLFLFGRRKGALSKLVETWREKITTSSEMHSKLIKGYFGFLEHQLEWEQKFKGTTAVKFKAAVTNFVNYNARQTAANRRFQDAEKRAQSVGYPFIILGAVAAVSLAVMNLLQIEALYWLGVVGGIAGFIGLGVWSLKRVAAIQWLLTDQVIVITGEELPLELATAFGGLVKKEEFKPGTVLEDIETLFDVTNKGLAEIKNAFEGADQNKKDIEALEATVTELQGKMTTIGLTFDPYTLRYDQLKQGVAAFLAILDENPLDAFKGSEEVEAGYEALKADLVRAIAIQESFADTTRAIGKAQERVTGLRAQTVDYRYALTGSEARNLAAGGNYVLNEEGANPDKIIAEASGHFDKAKKAVLAGKLDVASDEKALAEKASAEAIALVEDILAAKTLVEKQVVPVRSKLDKLQSDIPAAEKAVTELKAEFLAKNFPGEPEKVDTANKVADSTNAELAKVKKAYDEQRYLAARKLLTTLGDNIQHSIDAMVEVHSRLAKLRDLKKHARDTVARATQLAAALADKLETNAFTTAAETDQAYARQTPVLKTQQTDVAKDITDWVVAASNADTLEAALKAVDKAIDEQKAQHANAVSAISALGGAITDALGDVRHTDTRQPAKSKLSEAQTVLATVEGAVKKAKSDWAVIARKANDAKSMATEAKRLARADQDAADTARSAISSARSNIRGTRTSFDHGVTASMSSANSLLGQAERELAAGNYENATSTAKRASSAADQAEREALARVAAIVAELERQRRERERREREERERREAAERRRREESSSSSGGGFSSGGRSGGGFSSGGRSGGGGDF